MAIINIGIDGTNMVPVNGQYVFTITFINPTTGQLSTDSRFPQNQVYTTSSFVEPYFIPVQVADGNYTIGNIELRVKYKDQEVATGLNGRVINCNAVCAALPISTVNVNGSSLNIVLSATSVNTYNWRILNSSSVIVTTGTSNVTTNNFNITIPVLPAGKYLLELIGSNCNGKSIKNFTVVSTALPTCDRGPTIFNILSSTATSLQFQFDGAGIFGITWRIKQGAVTLRNGVIKHTSVAQPGDVTFNNSSPTITYTSIPNGNYTLEIEGSLCESEEISTSPFTISVVEEPLAFTNNSPTSSQNGSSFNLSTYINKNGTYLTTILNTGTGIYHHNGNVIYAVGTPFIKTGLPSGEYLVKVGTIEKIVPVFSSGGGNTGNMEVSVFYSNNNN